MTSRAQKARAWLAVFTSLALGACSSLGEFTHSRQQSIYEDDGSGVKPRVRIARFVGDAVTGVFEVAGALVMAIIPDAVESPDIDLVGLNLHPRVISDQPRVQCVPFARTRSGIEIYGDAWRWWDMERAAYPRDARPAATAVLVLKGYRGQRRGHVAVVTRVIDSRTIVIDHANWLNDEKIYLDQPVIDVSKNNDWSEVRVWHTPSQRYGARRYKTRGFIYPDMQVAEAAMAGDRTTMVAFAPPGAPAADTPIAADTPVAADTSAPGRRADMVAVILPRAKPEDDTPGDDTTDTAHEPEFRGSIIRDTRVAANSSDNAAPTGGWVVPVPKPVIVGAGALSLR